MQPLLQPGLYQHYKGGLYQVIDVAMHSEEVSPMVVYRALYGDFGLWVRPLAMFTEKVTLANGTQVPRFQLMQSNE